MALKFLYITTDPFVNNTQEFVRILAVYNLPFVGPLSGVGSSGVLYDQNGSPVAQVAAFGENIASSSTAYPYATAVSYSAMQVVIVPPGWSLKNFGRAVAVQGSLEEVLRVH